MNIYRIFYITFYRIWEERESQNNVSYWLTKWLKNDINSDNNL